MLIMSRVFSLNPRDLWVILNQIILISLGVKTLKCLWIVLVLSACSLGAQAPHEEPMSAQVIVVGAGMSGLAAARTLVDQGYQVLVLESQDRIGGRLWTDRSLGVPLDLGGSWIHGTQGNPLTELARKAGAKTVETDGKSGVAYDAQGKLLADSRYEQMEELFSSVYQEVEEGREELERDTTLQAALDHVISRRKLTKAQIADLNFMLQQNFSLEAGADPAQLSLWNWDQDEGFEGEEVVFPKGYNQLTDYLAQGLKIRLNQRVTRIEYSAKGVTLHTSSGRFKAGFAVVTLPLGVLKKGEVVFDPPLPSQKLQSIQRLGMGVLNKVYLKFPTVFWDRSAQVISYLGTKIGQWSDWMNFFALMKEPVLMAFHGGAQGFALEELTDQQIIDGAMKTLRTLYGNSIPQPVGTLITRWGKDPNAYGSYSYNPPQSTGKDYDQLAAPVLGTLFFAGEATNRRYPGTAHGAYLSGVRAAKEVVAQGDR